MKCPICKSPVQIELVDLHTGNARCVCGYSQLYFRVAPGQWESQAARKKRLSNYRICDQCHTEYMHYQHSTSYAEIIKHICPKCAAPIIRKHEESVNMRRRYAARINGKKGAKPNFGLARRKHAPRT